MKPIDEVDFGLFCKNKLFRDFSPEQLKVIYQSTEQIQLKSGDTLFEQGEKINGLYFITKGSLEVDSQDLQNGIDLRSNQLKAGDVIGELNFIDRNLRSGKVKAKSNSLIRSISFAGLEKFLNQSSKYSSIYVHLSKSISHRLRDANKKMIDSLKNKAQESRTRIQMGYFLIYMILLLSVFPYMFKFLQYLIGSVPDTTIVTLPATIMIVVSVVVLFQISGMNWKQFGIRFSNWRQAAFDGFVFTIPVLLAGIGLKWFLIKFSPDYEGHPLIEPYTLFLDPANHNLHSWLRLNLIYWVIVVPIQELLARGYLQGLLELFLISKHKVFISIVLSNLIFGSLHLFLSFYIAVLVFIGGLFIGYVYSRTHNLLSSYIAHGLLGTWLLTLMGLNLAATNG